MIFQILAVLLCASAVSPLAIPFKLQAVSNVTQHSQVLSYDRGYWVTNITVGTPAQVFNVIIDTFSGSTWVADKSCMQHSETGFSGCSGKTALFNSAMSSTYQSVDNSEFVIRDHLGSGNGFVGMDTVKLGNDDGKAIVIPSATFGQMYNIPLGVSTVPDISGVLGLAFQSLALPKTTPVLLTAIQQGDVTQGIFTVWLEDQHETSDDGTHGVIYYGNNDPLHCNKTRVDHPLSKAEFFQLTVPSFGLNGRTIYNKPTQALIDTTSMYIFVPQQVAFYILQSLQFPVNTPLPATVPCDTKIDIAFNFNGNVEHVTELNLLLKQTDGTCQLAIRQSFSKNFDNGMRFELGIPFLRGRCSYFNVANHTLGFSDAKTHGGEH